MQDIKALIQNTKKLTLLYVEDNQEVRESTLKILQEFFDNIVVGVDGVDGLEKFKYNKIDIILTDINMPRLDGLSMLEEIQKIDSKVYMIVLSAHNEPTYFTNSIELGVKGYILKPIDLKQLLKMFSNIIDSIKEKSETQQSLNLLESYKGITDESVIISILDPNGVITYINDAFCDISGYQKDSLIGSDYHSLLHYKQPPEVHSEIWETIGINKKVWSGIVKFVSGQGNLHYLKTTIQPILTEDGEIVEFIALRDDITDIMNPHKQLADTIKRYEDPIVIYIKLKDFQRLEDSYSKAVIEEIQDQILTYFKKTTPKPLQRLFEVEKLYQLGDGEYSIIINKDKCSHSIEQLIVILKDFQQVVEKDSIIVVDSEYDISISVSIAYDGEELLESSKLAMKELDDNQKSFIIANNFASIAKTRAKHDIETISMVKKAINDLKIISHFQPIVDNKTQKIAKYESLVRLIDESGNIISPFQFLDVTKKGKYYAQITEMVLSNSFSALKNTDMNISINLSVLDIDRVQTREKLFALLEEYKEHTSRVVFEILEDESIQDIDTIKEFIIAVKDYGVQIAIDDFGTGYSNFKRLLNYQPDILKIDGSLIRNIESDTYSYSIVKSIVTFAKEQNIKTIAEYVESEAIFNILRDMGIDYSQGYYFGKPEVLEG